MLTRYIAFAEDFLRSRRTTFLRRWSHPHVCSAPTSPRLVSELLPSFLPRHWNSLFLNHFRSTVSKEQGSARLANYASYFVPVSPRILILSLLGLLLSGARIVIASVLNHLSIWFRHSELGSAVTFPSVLIFLPKAVFCCLPYQPASSLALNPYPSSLIFSSSFLTIA